MYEFTCPDCKYHYLEGMPKSLCFCEKEKDPDQTPYRIPHSCGKICKKKRNDICEHLSCNFECHPGPCAPCNEVKEWTCYCSKES